MKTPAVALAWLVSVATLPVAPTAYSAVERPEIQEILKYLGPAPLHWDSNARMALSENILAYCNAVRADLPTNSPSEADWVMSESKTTDSAKISRLFNSAEFARMMLVEAYDGCIRQVTNIKLFQSREKYKLEAAAWIELAITFNSGDLSIYSKRLSIEERITGLDWLTFIRKLILNSAFASLADTAH